MLTKAYGRRGQDAKTASQALLTIPKAAKGCRVMGKVARREIGSVGMVAA